MYDEIARIICAAKSVIALTGAGISAESGIPTFRDKGGLWEKYDPMVYAHIDTFHKDPSKYWSIREEFVRDYAKYPPNPGHLALVKMEQLGLLQYIITQNIDGLFHTAGGQNVIEIHGNVRDIDCLSCGRHYVAPNIPQSNLSQGEVPRCESCGGILKPRTVLFGEALPADALETSLRACRNCKVMLVVGTSATVQPVASFPGLAKQNGAVIVDINPNPAFDIADFVIAERASVGLTNLLRAIERLI